MNITLWQIIAVVLIILIIAIWIRTHGFKVETRPIISSYCPICLKAYDLTRRPVVFHTSYKPERVITACQICNEIEYLSRTDNLTRRLNAIKRYTNAHS